MERDRLTALLDDQHTFPGPFTYRAFVRAGDESAVVDALRAACPDPDHVTEVQARPSRRGTWTALHLTVHVADPEMVLSLYTVLHGLDEVRLTM